MKKFITTFFILILMAISGIVIFGYVIKDDLNKQYDYLNSIPKEYKDKVLANGTVKKYIDSLDKEKIKKIVQEKINIEKDFYNIQFEDGIFIIKYNKYKVDGKEGYNKETFNQIIINYILNNENFNFDKIINDYNYTLTEKNINISIKNNAINNGYYEQLKNSLKIKNKDINYDILFNNLLTGTETNLYETKTIKINIDKLSQTIIPQIEDKMKLISSRTRYDFYKDKNYRKFNIKAVYDTIENNLFILKPNETFSFDSIYNENDNGRKYKTGYAIIGGKEKPIYGGGVCGAATGFYQGVLQNSGLEIQSRNHSIWYGNLYSSYINGKKITTPGLDSTYFGGIVDLKITNVTKFPIWMINKINGSKEENFSLSFENSKITTKKIIFNGRKGNCYYWKIGNDNKSSCYVETL